ncbi:MAG: SDR family NAD(P)-dependent oxidoreductase, partial [Planctomycetaceae bacterium]
MSSELAGRTALVTGGSRGIGRDCSQRLAAAGARIAVNYRTNQSAARETVDAITDAGGHAICVQADVSHSDQVDDLVQRVERELG